MYLAFISVINLLKILLASIVAALSYPFIGKKSVYFFLRLSGPTFIKLGQLLSSRSDLIGEDLAEVLSVFQDRLNPFKFSTAKKIIEVEFGKKPEELFVEFTETPVASASVAQVHKAKIKDNSIVAVKILRPNIAKLMSRDIATLKLIAHIVGLFSRYNKEKLTDIILLLEISAKRELDLMFEASAASSLKEKLQDVSGFYIPKIYWNLTTRKVLTMEWIDGIPFSDYQSIKASKFDKKKIAENLVISYFNQVYEHGFFHADMHPGNLFLMGNGDIGLIDFGIVGIIDKKTRIAVAQILINFLKRDYEKVAKIHIDNDFIPRDTDIADFALTCRIIGESMVDLSVKQISLAKILFQLLKMTRKYNMVTKPELLLLQKTMMLVEGVGVSLDDNLNMWELARPWMKNWAAKNIGFDAKIRDNLLDMLSAIKNIPEKFSENNSKIDLMKIKLQEFQISEKRWKIATLITVMVLIISLFVRV